MQNLVQIIERLVKQRRKNQKRPARRRTRSTRKILILKNHFQKASLLDKIHPESRVKTTKESPKTRKRKDRWRARRKLIIKSQMLMDMVQIRELNRKISRKGRSRMQDQNEVKKGPEETRRVSSKSLKKTTSFLLMLS